MEKLTGPLAEALARNRDAFNTKFSVAKSISPTLDGEAFSQHLAEVLGPLIRAVADTFTEKVDAVTTALYDLSVDLFVAKLLGPEAKTMWISTLWRDVLPRMTALLAREPTRLTVALCNAVVNVAAVPGARPQQWLDRLVAIGPKCSSTTILLDCGKVLAWQTGLAHFRPTALEAACSLPPAVAAGALGISTITTGDQLASAVQRLKDDPWLSPELALRPPSTQRRLRMIRQVGAFRGFGGPFLRPPTVSTYDDHLFVSDGEAVWQLFADRFGATFFRTEHVDPQHAVAPQAVIDRHGTVRWNEMSGKFCDLAQTTSFATDRYTLAATLPTSYHVFLMAPTDDDSV